MSETNDTHTSSTRGRSPIACVLLPELPIVAHHPDAADGPDARGVHRGRGTAARIRWADGVAREHGIREGQTLAAARARCASLRSVLCDETLLHEAQRLVTSALLAWTPRVAAAGVGRFLCEPVGEGWADRARVGLAAWGRVRIGIGAWATVAYAGALRDAGHVEPSILDAAPLHVLELDASTIDDLGAIGVRTVAALRSLDPTDLGVRFGATVASAWRYAQGDDPRGPTS